MRVLHVVRRFWPAVGGLENYVFELATEQLRNGLQADVLTLNRIHPNFDQILPSSDEICGVKIHRISYFGSGRYPIAASAVLHLKSYDIVHVHAVDFFCDYLAATSIFHGKPLVLSTHGGFFHTPKNALLKRLFFSTVTKASIKRYHTVIASSVNDEKLFQHVADGRLYRIDNGVDTSKFRNLASPDLNPGLIYFGRFAQNKGLASLVESFAHLKQMVPDASLHLVGNDYDGVLPAIREKVGGFEGSGISIHTGQDNAGLRSIIGQCSFFVSASRYEGFGLSLVEAMSAGLIPIVNRIPSFSSIILSADVGYLTDFADAAGSANDLAGALTAAARDHQEMRKAVIKASDAYSWKHTVKKFDAVYSDVLGLKKRQIVGVDIAVLERKQAIDYIKHSLSSGRKLKVAFASAWTLNLAADNAKYRAALKDFLVLNDGVGVDLASRMKFGQTFPENLNGTDFVPEFLSNCEKPLRLFLVGSSSEVVKRAAAKFSEWWPHHTVVGFRNGFFKNEAEIKEECTNIRSASVDVVLVGMGNPLQELWIAENETQIGAKAMFGVGALFDFCSGNVSRAPLWVQRVRGEWLYRLALEPKRLGYRYLIGSPKFLFRAFNDRRKLEVGGSSLSVEAVV